MVGFWGGVVSKMLSGHFVTMECGTKNVLYWLWVTIAGCCLTNELVDTWWVNETVFTWILPSFPPLPPPLSLPFPSPPLSPFSPPPPSLPPLPFPPSSLPVAIKQIKEIRRGRSTETFKAARDNSEQDKCFSIVYLDGGKHVNLDLVALSHSDAEAWVTGLGTLIKEMGRANFCRNMINIQSNSTVR